MREKKECILCNIYFACHFFIICVVSRYIVCCTNFKKKCNFTSNQKPLLHKSINQSQSIKIHMLLNILRRTKWVDLDLLLVYFMISYLTEPLNHLTPRIITLCPYSLDYENMLFLTSLVSRLFNLLTWGVTFLEMGWLGPLLDLNLISVFSFFTAAIADKKKLLNIKN